MVTYAGDVCLLNFTATLFKIVWSGDHWYAERLVDTRFQNGSIYLVDSAGKLLLVQDGLVTVSVNVEQKVLEPINCIGSCALFLCNNKCLSVDADKLPSIDGNCIYKSDWSFGRDTMCVVYDLSDGIDGYITGCGLQVPGLESEMIYQGPLSLSQVILTSCPTVKSQLGFINQSERIHQFSRCWTECCWAQIGAASGWSLGWRSDEDLVANCLFGLFIKWCSCSPVTCCRWWCPDSRCVSLLLFSLCSF